MTAQLTIGDCDPMWADLLGDAAEEARNPVKPRWLDHRQARDLRGQRITALRKYRITDVHVVGDWL